MADNQARLLRCTISNNTDNFVKKGDDTHDIKDWHGSSGERPAIIEAQGKKSFQHIPDPYSRCMGSMGGNAYIYDNSFKWIFAWSTHEENYKVYTDIQNVDYKIDWDHVLHELRNTCNDNASKIENGFKSTVTIEETAHRRPSLMATLDKI